jgi:integrase
MRGFGRVFRRGNVYWIAYSHRGREYRESSKSTREVDAKRLLKKRLGEIGKGAFTGPQEGRVYVEDLLRLVERDHVLNRRRSPANKVLIAHIRQHFSALRAVDVTPFQIDEYIQKRLQSGKSHGTVNRELNILRRAYRLGVVSDIISRIPQIKRLPDRHVRQGFFEYHEIQAVIEHLPHHLKDFTYFGYLSGWRKGEMANLEWSDVDRHGRVVHLRPEKSKTDEARLLTLEGELWNIIHKRWAERRLPGADHIVPWVFHQNGRKIGYIQRSWNTACKKAGVPGKLFHDLRRTAVRNMIRARIPERIAMSVSGHRSRAIFDRYNIVNETDQRLAMRRVQQYTQKLGQFSDNLDDS